MDIYQTGNRLCSIWSVEFEKVDCWKMFMLLLCLCFLFRWILLLQVAKLVVHITNVCSSTSQIEASSEFTNERRMSISFLPNDPAAMSFLEVCKHFWSHSFCWILSFVQIICFTLHLIFPFLGRPECCMLWVPLNLDGLQYQCFSWSDC